MNARDLFQLSVRIVGLVFLYVGLRAIPPALTLLLHGSSLSELHTSEPSAFSRIISALVMVGWPMLLAWWLIGGAPLLMRIAYRDKPTGG